MYAMHVIHTCNNLGYKKIISKNDDICKINESFQNHICVMNTKYCIGITVKNYYMNRKLFLVIFIY